MCEESLHDYYSEEPAVSKLGRLQMLFFTLFFDDTVQSRRSLIPKRYVTLDVWTCRNLTDSDNVTTLKYADITGKAAWDTHYSKLRVTTELQRQEE